MKTRRAISGLVVSAVKSEMKVIYLTSLLLIFCVNLSLSIRCYNCSLSDQKRCALSVNLPMHTCTEPNITAEEAKETGEKAVCIKTTKPPSDFNSTLLYTKRFCGMFNGKKDNCDEIIAEEVRNYPKSIVSCYSCDKDLCNGSDFHSLEMLVLTLTALASVMLLK